MLLQLPFDILQKVLCTLQGDVHEGFTARAEVIEGFEAHHMPSLPPPPSHALYCTCKVGGFPEGSLTHNEPLLAAAASSPLLGLLHTSYRYSQGGEAGSAPYLVLIVTLSPHCCCTLPPCKAARQAMLPCIGSARLLLAESEGREPGREGFVQYVVEQLRKFPSAATLRVLHLEIGAWYDDLADAILDERVCERLDQVVDLVVIQPGDAPGRPTNWRVICGMIAFAFPHLRSLALLMNIPPTLFVIRSLDRLMHLVDLRLHCVIPPASRVDPAVPPALGRITRLRCLSLLQASFCTPASATATATATAALLFLPAQAIDFSRCLSH